MWNIHIGGIASRSYYSGAFFLDGLRCWGNETALINCDHDGIAVHSCATHEVARVACQGILHVVIVIACLITVTTMAKLYPCVL